MTPLQLIAAAEDVPNGEQIKTWLLVLLFLLAVWDRVGKFTGRGEKREVSFSPDLVHRREFDEHRNGVREQLLDVKRVMEALPEKLEEKFQDRQDRTEDETAMRLEQHNKRITAIGEDVAELRGQIGVHRRRNPGTHP